VVGEGVDTAQVAALREQRDDGLRVLEPESTATLQDVGVPVLEACACSSRSRRRRSRRSAYRSSRVCLSCIAVSAITVSPINVLRSAVVCAGASVLRADRREIESALHPDQTFVLGWA